MEKSVIIILFHVGFGLWHCCYGLPIDFSTVGMGKLNAIWLTSSILMAIGFLIGIVSLIIGCICCRNGRGFQQNDAKPVEEFRNSNACLSTPVVDGFVNPTASSEITIFPPFGVTSNVSSRSSIVHFEPLPNIKPQVPNLRPAAFSYSEQEISSQDWFYDPYNNFPRNQLKYLQEYGKGWFGRVVEGEAQNIVGNEKVTKVMVKILHEDATPTDQMYFLHEVKFYRDLKHPNILSLLGRCLETEPFLILLESCPNGDLKSFLTQNMASANALVEQGVILRMCSNITAGLQYMHENKFIHTDLAARNCLVTPDLTVKIGDYGNSIEVFKSDYYCAGSVALPVRWCAPETLKCTDVTIETREVTPVANVWTLAVVIWEICEFCKLPYEELNDDQVIVRVLGEKNYFLQIPKMFCLYKDELYHLMKLCWSSPLQRPTAAQIGVILENLLSSTRNKEGEDVHRLSQDFETRWQKSKPNYIPKKDNAGDLDDSSQPVTSTTKFKGSKVGDSSYMDSPLGVFMMNKSKGQNSPRFTLKPESGRVDKFNGETQLPEAESKVSSNVPEEEYFNALKKSDSVKNLSGSLDRLNTIAQELQDKGFKGDFDFKSEFKPANADSKQSNPEIESWLKGVEVNNEEDETFVRKISEAIRDLDAALALEKTSSSEENSGKSSHQNSPGKETKEDDPVPVVDFKLGGGTTTSFINFIPKSFELSSLQNSEEPQSLNFNVIGNEKRNNFQINSTYGSEEQSNYINPMINDPRNSFKFKNTLFDESLKVTDSLMNAQSRNSSDTEDEIWRRRIERGEFSEKVKEKSKSIANLMVLTHIDASDESDVDLDKSFEKSFYRNSYGRRYYSNPKSSLTSNNFGSENDLTNAVLEDTFKESLKKLSNDHKEYGHFDSLGMILPTAADRKTWGNILRKSNSEENVRESVVTGWESPQNAESANNETDPSEVLEMNESTMNNSDNRNNFLGETASRSVEKVVPEHSDNSASLNSRNAVDVDFVNSPVDCTLGVNCDNPNDSGSGGVSQIINESSQVDDSGDCSELVHSDEHPSSESSATGHVNSVPEKASDSALFLEFGPPDMKIDIVADSGTGSEISKSEHPSENARLEKEPVNELFHQTISVSVEGAKVENSDLNSAIQEVPEITVTEEDQSPVTEEAFESVAFEMPKMRPFKFVLKSEEKSEAVRSEDDDENVPKNSQPIDDKTMENDLEKARVVKSISEKIQMPRLTNNKSVSSFSPIETFQYLSEKYHNSENDQVQVIIGACEDYTLDYFKGLKTTYGKADEIDRNPEVVTINKDVNLDVWDKHLDQSITKILDNTNFDEINFFSLNLETSGKDVEIQAIGSDNSVSTSPNSSLTNVDEFSMKEKKNEDVIHANGFTNLNGNTSEEEYENSKLRTPDDERSSDSGFRDKGSLSESVEDACEGKYNLEDIEAELEEAYVKGAFNGRELEKPKDLSGVSRASNNFEYEENKFYEDENKNEDDFSDFDGEIEFWKNQENSDYYPEISEFNPINSHGWYLHPPDESGYVSNASLDEEFVNALRNELRQKLPIQSRSFHEFNESDDDSEDEKSGKYGGNSGVPLSPILEESDLAAGEQEQVFFPSQESTVQKTRKNVINLMETGKSVDTNAFVQYLDYMVETEGKDKEGALLQDDGNENLHDSLCDSNDIIVVDTETNEVTLFETAPSSKTDADDAIDVFSDDGMIDSEQDRSLSDPSRSSNGSRVGDVSEMTVSSSDILSECYLTPTSEKSPFESPDHSNISPTSDNHQEGLDCRTKNVSIEEEEEYLTRAETGYEMSTSFMGEDSCSDDAHSEDGQEELDNKEDTGNVMSNDWESLSSGGEEELSSSSGEFIWKDGEKESKVKVKQVTDIGVEEPLFQDLEPEWTLDREKPIENQVREQIQEVNEEEDYDGNCVEDGNNSDFTDSDDDRDGSSTGSSASITDFVPSAWNSQATPNRPALRSPDKKTDSQKRSVWFKKQKYHCIYEYPREPSDTESAANSPQKHFTYGIDTSDVSNKYFAYGINNKMNLTNKYFTYGLSDLIDYSNYVDWDVVEGEEGSRGDQSEDVLSEDGTQKPKKTSALQDFYTLNSFDYDFNGSSLSNDDEFFVSSSARPFQGSSSQFFPCSSRYTLSRYVQDDGNVSDENCNLGSDSKEDGIAKTEELNESNNILDNLKFRFKEKPISDAFRDCDSSSSIDLCNPIPNSPANSLSATGLGELRHTRNKLKLDLPTNHNVELDLSIGKGSSAVKAEELTPQN